MNNKNKRAVVSWTGGKDCNVALFEAQQQGYEIVCLITFAMADPKFKAHPFVVMEKQAASLGIPHAVVVVTEPYKEGYEQAILQIKNQYSIDTIVTGDIVEVHGNENWMTECSKPANVNVLLPLWHLNRHEILNKMFDSGFKIIFSCVKEPWFASDWLGKELTREVVSELNEIHEQKNLDICGEQGEYHTLVLDGPMYKKKIVIDSFTKKKENEIMYMEINKISMKEKQLS